MQSQLKCTFNRPPAASVAVRLRIRRQRLQRHCRCQAAQPSQPAERSSTVAKSAAAEMDAPQAVQTEQEVGRVRCCPPEPLRSAVHFDHYHMSSRSGARWEGLCRLCAAGRHQKETSQWFLPAGVRAALSMLHRSSRMKAWSMNEGCDSIGRLGSCRCPTRGACVCRHRCGPLKFHTDATDDNTPRNILEEIIWCGATH